MVTGVVDGYRCGDVVITVKFDYWLVWIHLLLQPGCALFLLVPLGTSPAVEYIRLESMVDCWCRNIRTHPNNLPFQSNILYLVRSGGLTLLCWLSACTKRLRNRLQVCQTILFGCSAMPTRHRLSQVLLDCLSLRFVQIVQSVVPFLPEHF